ncbi:MAG: hypothetical protein SPF74_00975 [Candidatus Limivicinus sp.]|nr:hypothetical protein [Candidatus Limivicinus sp.]
MGLLSSAFAIKKIQNIKKGGIEQLSVADIAMVITNLQDAQKNLPKDKFDKIYSLFNEFCKCTLKTSMGINEYLNTAIKIISKYDEIAPYEKYSGGDKMEFSVIMDDIRKNRVNDNIVQILHNICMDYQNEYAITEYIKKIQSGFPMSIPHNTMLAFVGVLLSNDLYGKSVAMNYFDKLANYVIGHNEAYCGSYLAYLCGVLCANNVIGKNESKELAEKYIRQILLQKANIDDALSKSEKNERYDDEEEYDEDAEYDEDEDCDEDEEYDESEDWDENEEYDEDEDCDGKDQEHDDMNVCSDEVVHYYDGDEIEYHYVDKFDDKDEECYYEMKDAADERRFHRWDLDEINKKLNIIFDSWVSAFPHPAEADWRLLYMTQQRAAETWSKSESKPDLDLYADIEKNRRMVSFLRLFFESFLKDMSLITLYRYKFEIKQRYEKLYSENLAVIDLIFEEIMEIWEDVNPVEADIKLRNEAALIRRQRDGWHWDDNEFFEDDFSNFLPMSYNFMYKQEE